MATVAAPARDVKRAHPIAVRTGILLGVVAIMLAAFLWLAARSSARRARTARSRWRARRVRSDRGG
jgi:hypothetical protein